jgi:hypothetical protein
MKLTDPTFAPSPETRVVRKSKAAKPRLAAGTGSKAALLPHLTIRFENASEFVEEYADNITQGGLFLRGEYQLERLAQVELELRMPGLGAVLTPARVVHCTRTGVGLDLAEANDDFYATLRSYLMLLGKRRLLSLVACDQELVERLAAAGYCVSFAASPNQVVGLFARGIGAVVVRPQDIEGISLVVDRDFLVHYDGDFEQLLLELDKLLPA